MSNNHKSVPLLWPCLSCGYIVGGHLFNDVAQVSLLQRTKRKQILHSIILGSARYFCVNILIPQTRTNFVFITFQFCLQFALLRGFLSRFSLKVTGKSRELLKLKTLNFMINSRSYIAKRCWQTQSIWNLLIDVPYTIFLVIQVICIVIIIRILYSKLMVGKLSREKLMKYRYNQKI